MGGVGRHGQRLGMVQTYAADELLVSAMPATACTGRAYEAGEQPCGHSILRHQHVKHDPLPPDACFLLLLRTHAHHN